MHLILKNKIWWLINLKKNYNKEKNSGKKMFTLTTKIFFNINSIVYQIDKPLSKNVIL